MTHPRNISGLKNTAKCKHKETLNKAEQAIQTLANQSREINFNTVAKAASVSKTWLYNQPLIRKKIEELRKHKLSKKQTHDISDKSKDNILKILHEKIKLLEQENKILKQKLEVAYGKIYQFEMDRDTMV